MPLILNISDNVVCARLSGEIDHHGAKALREQIDSAAERVRPELLELDFSAVTFMDSSGIGLIMGRCRLMESLGGRVRVSGVSGQLGKVLRLSGIDRVAAIDRAESPARSKKDQERRRADETDQ